MNKQLEELERERKKLEELTEPHELYSDKVIRQSLVVERLLDKIQTF